MPRIRSIKPEIWGSSQIMNVSRDARLLFVGMITQADDAGRGSADARKLRGQIFPGDDDLSLSAMSALLAELERERLVILYEVNGDRLFTLPTWGRHQRIEKPSPSRYPAPPSFADCSTNPPRELVEGSSTDRDQGSGSGSGSGSGIKDQGRDKETDHDQSRAREHELHPEFERCMASYPRYSGRKNLREAAKQAGKLVKARRTTWPLLHRQVQDYATFVTLTQRKVMAPQSFFSAADDDPPCLQDWQKALHPTRVTSEGTSVAKDLESIESLVLVRQQIRPAYPISPICQCAGGDH